MSVLVNGTIMQNGNTCDMIFSVRQIIAHLSELATLHPGDIIATGTPAGVGMGKKPVPQYLQDGDIIETTISGLGSQRQLVATEN